MAVKLSAITFIFNDAEGDFIEPCLQSLSFADEIIVIDNGASERTLSLVKKYTDKIYSCAAKDFALRHNLGSEKAKGDWLLFIDSDERVSQRLSQEIKRVVENPESSLGAYSILRINYYLGKLVRHGDRLPDYVTRLFTRTALKKWTGIIHESTEIEGKVGKISAPIYHLTHRDVDSMVLKTLNFSRHEARIRLDINHPPVVWWRLLRVCFTEFWHRFVKLQAWRQGTEGWIDGLIQVFSYFIIYAQLWEMQRKEPLEKTYREIDKKIISGEI